LHVRNSPTAQALLAASPRFPRAAQHGAFPLRLALWGRQRRYTRQRSEALCSGLVPESYAPLRLLAPPRLALRSRFYPHRPPGGLRSMVAFPVARPFVCGCRTISTLPSPQTIPGLPGSPTPLPHRVARTHRSAMGWNQTPSPPECRLDPSPSLADRFLPGMAPIDDDPVVLHKPFRPHLAVGALPSKASVEVASGPPSLSPAFAFVPE
jgi:hypothetical protein